MEDVSKPCAAVEILRELSGPATAKKLKSELRRRERWTDEQAAASIEQGIAAGEVFVWPRYRNAVRYWTRDPAVETRAAAVAAASDRALPRRALVTAIAANAHHCGKAAAEAAVKSLLSEGALRAARVMGPTPLLYATPQALVKGATAILTERLRALGVEAQAPVPVEPHAAEPAAERLLAAVRRLQPAPAVPVTVHSLRAALPDLDKQAFDRAAIELADRQQVYLTTHDHGWALSESERGQLIFDGGQKLYVAVTLR